MARELKPLGARNLETAITLAKHYRDLNQPEEAESICRDILAMAPDNDDAWRTLGLALTDRNSLAGIVRAHAQAKASDRERSRPLRISGGSAGGR